jgi:cell division septal protein FtsQ
MRQKGKLKKKALLRQDGKAFMKKKEKQKSFQSSPGKILRRKFLIVFTMIAAAIAIMFSFLSFFRVKTISVLHNQKITTEEILEAANIPLNRHIFSISAKKAEVSVLSLSPYIKSVQIKRNFPSEFVIEMQEYQADFYVLIEEKYYLVTDTLLVLEEISEEELPNINASELRLPEVNTDEKKFKVGKTIVFQEKSDRERIPYLMETLSKSSLFDSFTKVYLDEEANLTVVVNGQYTIRLGNKDDMEKKIALCEEAVAYLSENMPTITGTIYAWTGEKVTFEMTGVT